GDRRPGPLRDPVVLHRPAVGARHRRLGADLRPQLAPRWSAARRPRGGVLHHRPAHQVRAPLAAEPEDRLGRHRPQLPGRPDRRVAAPAGRGHRLLHL
ncbi:MAG: hypothetical protein AVDCRST_MAG06-2277, partial [uncultured Nocardioides sp.]